MINKVLLVVYILYCLEVGFFLIIFPWMRIWEQNLVLQYFPVLRFLFLNHYFRGAVSGLGAANLILGVWEVAHFNRNNKKE